MKVNNDHIPKMFLTFKLNIEIKFQKVLKGQNKLMKFYAIEIQMQVKHWSMKW